MHTLLDSAAKDRYEAMLLEAELERKYSSLKKAAADAQASTKPKRPGFIKKLVALLH